MNHRRPEELISRYYTLDISLQKSSSALKVAFPCENNHLWGLWWVQLANKETQLFYRGLPTHQKSKKLALYPCYFLLIKRLVRRICLKLVYSAQVRWCFEYSRQGTRDNPIFSTPPPPPLSPSHLARKQQASDAETGKKLHTIRALYGHRKSPKLASFSRYKHFYLKKASWIYLKAVWCDYVTNRYRRRLTIFSSN